MEYVMKYNFDEAVERRGTGCLKYDFAKERGKKEDVLPLWVADMDFKTAPAVTERLQKVVEHGIYGYSDSKEDYFAAVKRLSDMAKENNITKTALIVVGDVLGSDYELSKLYDKNFKTEYRK